MVLFFCVSGRWSLGGVGEGVVVFWSIGDEYIYRCLLI